MYSKWVWVYQGVGMTWYTTGMLSSLQVMMQRNNRCSSMSIYLAALTIPDSIVLFIGRSETCRNIFTPIIL